MAFPPGRRAQPSRAGARVASALYRWENNIRAAALLCVVGGDAMGQLLAFHLGLFYKGKTASILVAMLLPVTLVDGLSLAMRRAMAR